MSVEPGKFTWMLSMLDGSKIECVTLFDARTWKETWRFSRAGATWNTVFEMTMRKVD